MMEITYTKTETLALTLDTGESIIELLDMATNTMGCSMDDLTEFKLHEWEDYNGRLTFTFVREKQ